VGAAYGIRGWIKVHPHADDASALLHARRWWLLRAPPAGVVTAPAQSRGGERQDCPVARTQRYRGGASRRRFGSQCGRNAQGRRVWIRREDFPAPEEGEFYWVDLIGCAVVNEQGEALGEVTGLIDNGAHQILQVAFKLPDGKAAERLIPFVDAYLRTVDTSARRIVVDWGLDY
jgi:16S rRNA processing protein RimM